MIRVFNVLLILSIIHFNNINFIISMVSAIFQTVVGEQSPVLTSSELFITTYDNLPGKEQPPTMTNILSEIQPTKTSDYEYDYTSATYNIGNTEQAVSIRDYVKSSFMASLTEEYQWSTRGINTEESLSAISSNLNAQHLPLSVTTPTADMKMSDSIDGATVQSLFQYNSPEGSTYLDSWPIAPSDGFVEAISYSSDLSPSVGNQLVDGSISGMSTLYSTALGAFHASLPPQNSTEAFSVAVTATVMATTGSLSSMIQPTSVIRTEITQMITADESSEIFITNLNVQYTSVVEPSIASINVESVGTALLSSHSLDVTKFLETYLFYDSSLIFTPFSQHSAVVVEPSNTPALQMFTESFSELSPSFMLDFTGPVTYLTLSTLATEHVSTLSTLVTEHVSSFDIDYRKTLLTEVMPTVDMMSVTSQELNMSSLSYSVTNVPNYTTIPYVTQNDTTTEIITSTSVQPIMEYNVKVKLVLTGNCSILDQLNSADHLEDFRSRMGQALSSNLNLDMEQIHIIDTKCGSIIVKILLINITSIVNVSDSLKSMTGIMLFNASAGNRTFSFVLINSELLPTQILDTPKREEPDSLKLTDVQIIIIIVCSVIGGTLLMYAFGFCVYACYQRKKTQSFDLSETPISDLNMDDFTLTKMERPHLMYNDYGPIIQPTRKVNRSSNNYQPVEDEMQCVATDNIYTASTLPCRSSPEVAFNTQMDNHGVHDDQQGSQTSAFVNPSFSGDDSLISNSHAQWGSSVNPESQQTSHHEHRNDDVLTTGKNTNGHVIGESATSF